MAIAVPDLEYEYEYAFCRWPNNTRDRSRTGMPDPPNAFATPLRATTDLEQLEWAPVAEMQQRKFRNDACTGFNIIRPEIQQTLEWSYDAEWTDTEGIWKCSHAAMEGVFVVVRKYPLLTKIINMKTSIIDDPRTPVKVTFYNISGELLMTDQYSMWTTVDDILELYYLRAFIPRHREKYVKFTLDNHPEMIRHVHRVFQIKYLMQPDNRTGYAHGLTMARAMAVSIMGANVPYSEPPPAKRPKTSE